MVPDLEYLRSNIKSVCRTCYGISSHLHPLYKMTEQFPQKSLADLLFEIAKINIKQVLNEEVMPTQLCGNCSRKLKNAYKFVQRAQEINAKLLEYAELINRSCVEDEARSICASKHSDCLSEAPIDIPSNSADLLKIKMEAEKTDHTFFDSSSLQDNINNKQIPEEEVKGLFDNYDEEQHLFVNKCSKNTPLAPQLKNEDHNSENSAHDLCDPIRTPESKNKCRRDLGSDSENDCGISDSDWEEITSRRRGRHHKKKLKSKGCYSCKECGKTFVWKKDLKRHSLSHNPYPAYQCSFCEKKFSRKDKLNDHLKVHQRRMCEETGECSGKRIRHSEWKFAERLYSKNRFRKIECKLCDAVFEFTHQLRAHLFSHADISTLDKLNLNSEVVRVTCSNKIQNLNELKAQICQDISEQHFEKFCDIVNEHGYELCLSDSDLETEHSSSKYSCELCSERFIRKFSAFEHLKEKHGNDIKPHKCNVCKVEFICRKMFEVHVRSQCRNKEKKFQCPKCPGKFMWIANLDNHNCSNGLNNPEYKTKLLEKHNVREKTYIYRKDEKNHKGTQPIPTGDNLRWNCKLESAQLRRRIECSLCGEKFRLLKQLREHLEHHSDGNTGIKIEALFFKTFASEFSTNGVEIPNEMSQLICKDFVMQNTSRFYIAVDESGNELDLYESETDIDNETLPSLQKTSYKCEICLLEFDRKKKILLHQYAEHEKEELRYICEHCHKQFICVELLQNHITTICNNVYKTWSCHKCSSRFVWEENLQAHINLKHANPEEQIGRKLASKLQCDECDKTFIWPKDLNRHKRCHLPEDEKYECPLCPRRFNRKDNMHAHMKVHGAIERRQKFRSDMRTGKQARVKAIDENMCKPNGCKIIKCMICLSNHTKISDLRTHLRTHQYVVSLNDRRQNEDIAEISLQLYPDEEPINKEQLLIDRILTDVSKHRWDSFYSITNEMGYELNISDSETESESDEEPHIIRHAYSCDLCAKTFERKYKLFEHQKYMHDFLELPHACDVCNGRFASEKFLQIHEKMYCKNYRKRFFCKKCSLKFMWNDNLKYHERTTHPEKSEEKKKDAHNRYECRECHRTFAWQKDLTRHLVQHQPEGKFFKCLFCPRKFYRKDKLNMHIKRHDATPQSLAAAESYTRATSEPNGRKEIFCKICNIKFSNVFSLRSHILQSLFEVDLESLDAFKTESHRQSHHRYESLLNYSITNQLGYELHINDSESDVDNTIMPKAPGVPQKYSCELCRIELRRKYEIAQHQMRSHSYEQMPWKCEKCFFRTVSKDVLDYHMRTQCFSTEKKFQCHICSFKFMWKDNLERHIQCIHPQNVVPKKEISLKTKSKRSFQCELCKCKYNRKDRLTAHVKKVHAKGEEDNKAIDASSSNLSVAGPEKPQLQKRFLCAFCGRAVTSSSNLIIHMRRHTGEKPFKCEFCDMAFPRSSDLQCHRRTHTGEKPHKCTVCQKAFSRSYKLQTHMRIHSGERPYKCTYCEKSFTQSNDLTLHKRRHTGERPYVCGICGERFIQGTALKNHRTMRGHFEDTEPRKLSILEQF